jgi:hypothetical protein
MKIKNSEIELFKNQIINCLVIFGKISEPEAVELLKSSNLFNSELSEMGLNLIFHEPPYYWAMTLINLDNPDWIYDKKLWPPPEGYKF